MYYNKIQYIAYIVIYFSRMFDFIRFKTICSPTEIKIIKKNLEAKTSCQISWLC